MTSFVVKEPNSLSDHSLIITWLKVNRHLDNRDLKIRGRGVRTATGVDGED